MSFERKKIIDIVKRIIELKLEFWEKSNREEAPYNHILKGKSDGMEKTLTIIDGFLNFDEKIHKLIDDSRK